MQVRFMSGVTASASMLQISITILACRIIAGYQLLKFFGQSDQESSPAI